MDVSLAGEGTMCRQRAEQVNWVHRATFGNKAVKYGTSFGRK
jgi:hypothetical protein